MQAADLLQAADFARPEPQLRIVLVDEHRIMREGLKALIETCSDFNIVGGFGCGDDSLNGIRELQPDVVVMDLAPPGSSGIELLGEIKRLSPLTRKLVLTAHDTEANIRAALNVGADGYVLKTATSAELIIGIRSVSAGHQFLCKEIEQKIVSGYLAGGRRAAVPAPAACITGRERDVLTRIALGNSNKLIARELGVSPKTVEKHRSNLMRKLRLHNVAAITMYAVRNGMTGSEPFGKRAACAAPCKRSMAPVRVQRLTAPIASVG